MRAAALCLAITGLSCVGACATDLTALRPIERLATPSLCDGSLPSSEFDYRASYCGVLNRANEPLAPFTEGQQTKQAFRLIWNRSFDPTMVIRIEIASSETATLTATQLSQGRISEITIKTVVQLTAAEIAQVEKAFSEQDFWDQPHEFSVDMGFGPLEGFGPGASEAVVLSDGASWVLEGAEANRYQLMGDGGLGDLDSPPLKLGFVLIELAKKRIPSLDTKQIY